MNSKYWTTHLQAGEIERGTEVMGAAQRSSLILEATESQALLLQQSLSELEKTVDYQEEQHGSALFIYLRFQREQEKAVRRILADIGLRAPEQDDALSA